MKLRCTIAIVFCICSCRLFSQDAAEIKHLLTDLKKAETDTAKANIYARLCYNYCIINTDSAVWFGDTALKLAVKNNYTYGVANASNSLGWAYCCKGDNINGKKFLKNAYEKFKQIGEKHEVAIPLSNLGNIYISESNYPEALSCFSKAFDLFENANDDFRAAETLFSIGRIYNLENNPEKARNYFLQAYNIHKKEGNDLYMAQALTSIANTYQFQQRYDTALTFYKKVIPVFLKHKDFYRTGNAYENMAAAYKSKKQYATALKNMQQAKKYYEQIGAKSDMAYAYSGLGEIYALSGETDKAIENYKASLNLAASNTDYNLQQTVLAGLSDVYVKKQDYKNAYNLLDSSYKIKDSLFTKDKQDELLKLQTQFETVRKEKENQQLKTQNLSASLQLQHNYEWLIAAAAALLVAGILLFALYKNRQSKIKNIKALRALNAKLEEQTNEIKRINTILELKALRAQMNPHFIFNCMSSIQECMLTGRLDDANNYLTKLSRLLRMVLNYSDEETISLEKELQILELYLQLEKIRLKNNLNYDIELDNDIAEEELAVPTLILQPFAENAIWHGLVNRAGERRLAIKCSIKNEMLHLVVDDNGIGRELAQQLKPDAVKYPSKGISLIRKRLDIIKNKTSNSQTGFTIHDLYNNGAPAGTSVEINLPLEAI